MKQFISRLLAAKSTKLFAIFLLIPLVANPELLSLVSVLAVIGVDAFVLMVLWQLRGYFDIALMYASRLLNIRLKRHEQQEQSHLKSSDNLDASKEEKR